MFYFPLAPRLKAMYRSSIIAPLMTAWARNRCPDGTKMTGPYDSAAWRHVLEADWSCMSEDERHVWLGLAMDGLHPFGHQTKSHSTWPILLVVYNLDPWRSIHRRHMILNAIVPGNYHIFLNS
jgi:hypothetical protein